MSHQPTEELTRAAQRVDTLLTELVDNIWGLFIQEIEPDGETEADLNALIHCLLLAWIKSQALVQHHTKEGTE